jgi:hypothetical protein
LGGGQGGALRCLRCLAGSESSCLFFIAFLGVSQEALKKKKEKRRTYLPTYLLVDLLRHFLRFLGLILENIVMVFLSSSCRETGKNGIKKSKRKNDRKQVFFLNFFGKKFLTFPKKFFMVFLNSPW